MPASPTDGTVPSIGETEEIAIRDLGKRYVADIPSEGWDKADFRRVLRLVFESIDALGTQAEQERVWEARKHLGGGGPSYRIVGYRLARFLDESLRTFIEIIGVPPFA